MAGDWIKIRIDLFRDPAVLRIAKLTNLDKWSVVGRLSDIWSWIGGHTTTGVDVPVDSDMMDEHAACAGFAAAMRTVEWLQGRDGALVFPSWERHNSHSAKARALESEAKRLRRSGDEPGNSPGESKTDLSDICPTKKVRNVRLEKRREEKITISPSKARAGSEQEVIDYVKSLGLPETDGSYLWDSWEAGGWMRGSKAIKDWKATARTWIQRGFLPSQQQKGGTNGQKPNSRGIGGTYDPTGRIASQY